MKDRKHNTYSLDFKRQAVILASHPDIKAKDVADAVGIHHFMLSRWRKEMRDKKLTGKDAITIPVSDLNEAQRKIQRLEKELAKVKTENEILKKYERFVAENAQKRSK